MEHASLTELADEHIVAAAIASSGRSSRTIYGGTGHRLRQTLMALTAGRGLDEHENPGEATVQVLRGSVRLSSEEQTWDGGPGSYAVIPPGRHALEALTDCAVLLTVVASS
jgi:quercetin dioxygenase-like cupin family protein